MSPASPGSAGEATQCPMCAGELPGEARFCAFCGTPLRRCGTCARVYPPDAEFCGDCGVRLAAARHSAGVKAPLQTDLDQPDEDAKWLAEDRAELFGFLYEPSRPERRHHMRRGDTTVGAGEKNDLVIERPAISWNHAIFICRDERILVQDSASTNGTFINGNRVTRPRQLAHGDLLCFGNVEFRIWIKPQLRGAKP